MSKIEILEAAGYCATSSVAVSDEAVRQSASAEWAKKNGVDIQRYSLTKNPQQFLNSPVIKESLNVSGMDFLPITLLDGKSVIAGKFLAREDIARWAGIPFSQDQSEDGTQLRCCNIPHMP